MNNQTDLRQLAIERDRGSSGIVVRRHILTRYALPLLLILGFMSLIAWASRDYVFPPRPVTVLPVFATETRVHQTGTPLFNAAGWVEPRPTPIRVAALAPGVVEELLVVEDQWVSAGQPVARLIKDDAELNYQRAIADQQLQDAGLAQAKAELEAAHTKFEQPVHLQAELSAAEAALAKINTELTNLPFLQRRARADELALRRDYEGKLGSQGVVAKVEIDIAKGKLDAAQALVDELADRSASLQSERLALQAQRDALRTKLKLLADELQARDEAEAAVAAATARLELARVAVAEAKLRLDRMTVVSPVKGRVFHLVAHPGSRIGSGMIQMLGHDGSTVVSLYQPESLQVRVDVRFEDVPNVHMNQPVRINNPALSEPLVGRVLFISSIADIQKNTLEVKVEIPAKSASTDSPATDSPQTAQHPLKPDMLVDATFLAPEQPELASPADQKLRLYVPRRLVKSDSDGSFVWLADQARGVARMARIETGEATQGAMVEVTGGLNESSRLIDGDTEGLAPGDRIQVTGESSASDKLPAVPSAGESD